MLRTVAARHRHGANVYHRVVSWTKLFRKCKKKKSNKTSERRLVIEQEHLLDTEFENISEKLSSLSISQDFISEMREAFYLFDKDQNGYICSKELGHLLRTLGCNPTETEVNTLMAGVDVDHNGKIDLQEFVLMMHNTVGKIDTMEEIRMAFRAFDTDGDGRISKDEFRSCMLNFGERFSEEEILDMVKQADRDRNGFIDFKEFVEMITSEEEEPPYETHRKLVTQRK